jgi:hypothetical protein
MLCSLAAKLDEKALAEIRALEGELGATVLAFACHEAAPAQVDDAQLAKIRQLEEELGVSLVAVSS